jgi:hypothetical protein
MENCHGPKRYRPRFETHITELAESVKEANRIVDGLIWHLKRNFDMSVFSDSKIETVSKAAVEAFLDDTRLLYALTVVANERVTCYMCAKKFEPTDQPWCVECHHKAVRKAGGEGKCSRCEDPILLTDKLWCRECQSDAMTTQKGEVQ